MLLLNQEIISLIICWLFNHLQAGVAFTSENLLGGMEKQHRAGMG